MAHDSQRISGTLANPQLSALAAAFDELSVDTDRVLHASGLTRDQFADPRGRSPTACLFPFWQAALQVTGDPTLGLRAGQVLGRDTLARRVLELQPDPTPRALLERAPAYVRVLDDQAQLEWRVERDLVGVRLARSSGYPDAALDCMFAGLAALLQRLWPALPRNELRVRLSHASQLDAASYARCLGCAVELRAAHDELIFPGTWLDVRVSDSALDARASDSALDALGEHASPESASTLLETVRTQLSLRLAQGDIGLAMLSRALHMSERTLRRRLSEQGTSYQTLLDELRWNVARKLMEQPSQPVEAIAQQVGFADPSSFFHAFKRWTGKTPAQFRRELRGDSR